MSALLQLEGAVVALSKVRSLSPIDLSLATGELLVILGKNGAGKTSLLRAAAGIVPLASGTLTVKGQAIGRHPERRALSRALAYLPQGESGEATDLTVEELVELGRAPYASWLGRLGPADHQAMEAAMRAAEVEGLRDRRLDTLSAGERQRAHLARCFAQDTPLLLLDEPTASMDPVHAIELLDKVKERVASGERAALLVLHDLTLAARFADRIAILGEGRLLSLGPPSEVLVRPVLKAGLGIDAEVRIEDGEVVLRMR
jgi:iron complex transport system ATP-binding protein